MNGETVQAEPEINSDDALSQTEKDIIRILSEHGGVIATSEFKSVCLGMSVNRRTFYLNLVRSPIISTLGGHLYGLIGSGERSGTGQGFSGTGRLQHSRKPRARPPAQPGGPDESGLFR